MSKRLGMAYIQVTGIGMLATMPGAKLELGGVERTPVMQFDKLVGYSEQYHPARLTCQLSVGGADSLAELQALTDATVTFECDTGVTYMVAKAFCTKVLSLTAGGGGQVELELAGQPAQEMRAIDP